MSRIFPAVFTIADLDCTTKGDYGKDWPENEFDGKTRTQEYLDRTPLCLKTILFEWRRPRRKEQEPYLVVYSRPCEWADKIMTLSDAKFQERSRLWKEKEIHTDYMWSAIAYYLLDYAYCNEWMYAERILIDHVRANSDKLPSFEVGRLRDDCSYDVVGVKKEALFLNKKELEFAFKLYRLQVMSLDVGTDPIEGVGSV